MNILEAKPGKVFAYKDEEGEEIVLGSILYLGINDDGKRYYQIDAPKEIIPEYKEEEIQEEEITQ